MITFQPIAIVHKPRIDALLKAADFRAAEYSFANLFNWSGVFETEVAFIDGFFVIRSGAEKKNYLFPVGSGNFSGLVEQLLQDAEHNGQPFIMRGILTKEKELLERLFPGNFQFTLLRDAFDYIYWSENLIHLSGKKYQPKRNHISRFKKTFPHWAYESITTENLPECEKMNEEWCRLYGCNDNSSLKIESCAARKALHHYFEEELKGGLLRVNGQVIAFTIGEQLNSDTFIVHVEKAFGESYTGAYQVINQEFITHNAVHVLYVNREDDAGDEGLRKAKLSYQPAFLLEKYVAEYAG